MALKFDAAAKDPTKKLKDAIKTGKLGALVVDSTFIKIYTKNGKFLPGLNVHYSGSSTLVLFTLDN